MLRKIGIRGLVLLAAGGVAVVASTVFAATGLVWLAVAGIGAVQLLLLFLLLTFNANVAKPASALRQVDALAERVVTAVETGRLDAAERHQELLAAIGQRGDQTGAATS